MRLDSMSLLMTAIKPPQKSFYHTSMLDIKHRVTFGLVLPSQDATLHHSHMLAQSGLVTRPRGKELLVTLSKRK